MTFTLTLMHRGREAAPMMKEPFFHVNPMDGSLRRIAALSPHRLTSLLIVLALMSGAAIGSAGAATIELLVVYDTTAATWVADEGGGQHAFAMDTVTRMNQAAARSGLDLTFRLAHVMSVGYTSAGALGTDLERLQAGHGSFADAHTAREQYGADLVVLLVDTGSASGGVGVAYLMTQWQGNPQFGYSASAIRAAAIHHVVTHEVAHNLGAQHARNQISPGPNTFLDNEYSAGWYFSGTTDGQDYHTIMAYNVDSDRRRYASANLFSTPEQLYRGTPAGTNTADNVRLLRQTKHVVANYRDPVDRPIPDRPASILYPASSTTGLFQVSWSASEHATFYTLARSADGGSTWGAIYTGSRTEFDEDIGPGTYQYRVLAGNDQGSSQWQVGDDIAVSATDPIHSTVPVYRFFNPASGGHFFTINAAEAAVVRTMPNYADEGIGFNAYSEEKPGITPVYRFFNPTSGGHFFTANAAEAAYVRANLPAYSDEGVGFFAYATPADGAKPVYRFFNATSQGHLFTTNPGEAAYVRENLPLYSDEGIGFWTR